MLKNKIKYIAGRRCDTTAVNPNDPCSSNPCWGESLCIVLEMELSRFECLCPITRKGKFCQSIIEDQISIQEPIKVVEGKVENATIDNELLKMEFQKFNSSFFDLIHLKTTTFASTTTPSVEIANITFTTTGLISETDFTKIDNFTQLETSTVATSLNRTLPFNATSKIATISLTTSLIESNYTTRPTNNTNLNITARGLVDMSNNYYDNNEPCNFNNCKLGKCLLNDTCECVYPAVGVFCDQIDECSVLNCINV